MLNFHSKYRKMNGLVTHKLLGQTCRFVCLLDKITFNVYLKNKFRLQFFFCLKRFYILS